MRLDNARYVPSIVKSTCAIYRDVIIRVTAIIFSDPGNMGDMDIKSREVLWKILILLTTVTIIKNLAFYVSRPEVEKQNSLLICIEET